MKYKWLIKETYNFEKDFIDIAFGSEVIAKLLFNRGIETREKAIEYLQPEKYIESSPYEIPQLDVAKERIIKAIKNNEKIMIYGDYDVDGVTSTSCLLLTLKEYTQNVDYYIPNRLTEGYGLNSGAVEKFAKKKVNLLITCDCGVTNTNEIELANSLGIDVIVTDHHSLPEVLPPAHAVLNPQLLPDDHKLKHLPGVGVAYKLAEAILEDSDEEVLNSNFQKEELLDLVTLGMIADLAKLVDENRYLVQIGLPRLAHTKKVGLKELLRICGFKQGKDVDTDHVGFGIAPRINAVGRLTDANLAVKLFTTENEIEAIHLATELDIQNKERQLICEQTFNEALELAEEEAKNKKCIVLAKEGWHHGVVGIVASRILDKFHLPTILMGIDKKENVARGSGRSIDALNMIEALHKSNEPLNKYGGHTMACGLSILPENIEAFKEKFSSTVNEMLEDVSIEATLKIDTEIDLSDLNLDFMKKINKRAPFGLGNRMPVFSCNEIEIANMRQIGKDGKHLKLFLKHNKSQKFFEALIWNYDLALKNSNQYRLQPKDKIKIAFTPKINEFNGELNLQLELKDWDSVHATKSTYQESEDSKQAIRMHHTKAQNKINIIDCRNKTSDCIEKLGEEGIEYFAETTQKNFLPLKTNSRYKMSTCESLVLLEAPPDKKTLLEIISSVNPKNLYLAYSTEVQKPPEILKRLSGMMKYVENKKGGETNKTDLESALGINRTALIFAIEVLVKSGFLSYKQSVNTLHIKISESPRQISNKLIEYNLFAEELKQINTFRDFLTTTSTQEIEKVINKDVIATTHNNIKIKHEERETIDA